MRKKFLFLPLMLTLLLSGCSGQTSTNTDSNNDLELTIEWTIEKEPTCTQDGKKTRYDEEGNLIEETIPALGHDWGEWEIEIEPYCEYEGIKTRYCSRCYERERVDIPATGHTFVDDGFLYDEQTHCQYCIKCENYVNVQYHNLILLEENQLFMPVFFNENNSVYGITILLTDGPHSRNRDFLDYQTIKGNDKDAKNIISVFRPNGYPYNLIRCLDNDYYYVNYGSEKVYQCDDCGAKIAVKKLKTSEIIPEVYNSKLFTNAYEAYFEYDDNGNLISIESKYYGISSSREDYCYRTINRYFEYDEQNRVVSVKTSPNDNYRIVIYYNEEYDNKVYDIVYKCETFGSAGWESLHYPSLYILYDEFGRIYNAKMVEEYFNGITHETLFELSYYEDEFTLSSYKAECWALENDNYFYDSSSYQDYYWFDEYGNTIRREFWSESTNRESVTSYTNTYNSDGLITFQDIYSSSSSYEYYNISYDYRYDDENLIYISATTTRKTISGNVGVHLVEADIIYDNNGNIISMTVSENGTWGSPTTFSRVSDVIEEELTVLLN